MPVDDDDPRRIAQGDMEAAAKAFLAAAEVNPMPISFAKAGSVLMNAGKYKEALVQLERALSMDGGLLPARVHASECYAALRRYDKAEEHLKAIADLGRDGVRYATAKIRFLHRYRALKSGSSAPPEMEPALGKNYRNMYRGFTIPHEDWRPHRIGLPLRAADFDAEFRGRREPVIINSALAPWEPPGRSATTDAAATNVSTEPLDPELTRPLSAMCKRLRWRVCSWTDEYLIEHGGKELVYAQMRPLYHSNASPFTDAFSIWTHLETTTMDRFVNDTLVAGARRAAALRAGNAGSSAEPWAGKYLNMQGMREDGALVIVPPLTRYAADFDVPPFMTSWRVATARMWMGHSVIGEDPDYPIGSCSALHCDDQDNMIAVVRGRKRVLLVAPSDAERLRLVGTIRTVLPSGVVEFEDRHSQLMPHFSTIDFHGAATRVDALPKGVRHTVAELEAGMMLFIPAGWFHRVCSFGAHVSMNFWGEAKSPRASPAPERVAPGEPAGKAAAPKGKAGPPLKSEL